MFLKIPKLSLVDPSLLNAMPQHKNYYQQPIFEALWTSSFSIAQKKTKKTHQSGYLFKTKNQSYLEKLLLMGSVETILFLMLVKILGKTLQ